jgi:hypothetical protein
MRRSQAWKLSVVVSARVLQTQFFGEQTGIRRADAEGDEGSGIAKDGILKGFHNCETCWFAATSESRHLRASDRIDAKLSVAKFWNSST